MWVNKYRSETFYWFQFIGGVMLIIEVWGTIYYGYLRKTADQLPA